MFSPRTSPRSGVQTHHLTHYSARLRVSVHDNDVARAYDRGGCLQQRMKLMGWWHNQLDSVQRGAEIVTMTQGQAA